MAVVWPGRALVVGCVLAGCGGQALAPPGGALPTQPPPVRSMPEDSTTADAGAALGGIDARTTPDSVDAATAVIPVVQRARTNVLTSALVSNAEVLAADDDGIYWVTSENRLWILPAWSDTARVLAADPNLPSGVVGGQSLLVRGNSIFWSASVLRAGSSVSARPLHRTLKTGSDTVLLSDGPALLAADATSLYYPQGDVDHADLAIVALPFDATPGATPVTLAAIPPGTDVSALAVDDQNVYWTECAVGSSMFEGTGPIFGGGKASLLAGGHPSFGQLTGLFAYLLAPSGGRLYFGFAPTPGRGEVAVADGIEGAVATLPLPTTPRVVPLPAGKSLLALDGWLVSSTAEVPSSGGKIYAVAADAVVGGGQVAVQIADQVLVPPVAALPGLVFVDGSGHLLAVSAQDLGTAVAAGQR